MYLYLKCCLAVWIVATSLLQEPANKSRESTDTIELSRLETVWNEAYVHGDADALDRLCADDLVVTMTDMQILTKAAAIRILRLRHRANAVEDSFDESDGRFSGLALQPRPSG